MAHESKPANQNEFPIDEDIAAQRSLLHEIELSNAKLLKETGVLDVAIADAGDPDYDGLVSPKVFTKTETTSDGMVHTDIGIGWDERVPMNDNVTRIYHRWSPVAEFSGTEPVDIAALTPETFEHDVQVLPPYDRNDSVIVGSMAMGLALTHEAKILPDLSSDLSGVPTPKQ